MQHFWPALGTLVQFMNGRRTLWVAQPMLSTGSNLQASGSTVVFPLCVGSSSCFVRVHFRPMSSSVTGFVWLDWVVAGFLICASALFSGLTLGLMSLDLSALSVLAEAGDEHEREYAKKIIPLRRNGNLLLCTLLIGNTVVNSFLSILLASKLASVLGLLASTTLIVIFGEIAPQAICSRHGLFIGSRTRFITWACMGTLFVVAWPISKVLDLLLGREVGTMYSREELKHLIKLQVNEGAHPSGDGIDAEEHNLLAGVVLF